MTRTCKSCEEDQPLSEFSGGQRRTCNRCRAEQERRRRQRNAARGRGHEREREQDRRKSPEYRRYQRAYRLESRFGLTVGEFDEMLIAQAGRCALCSDPDPRLAVDHDHETGRVRGLLCRKCNTALGSLGDTAEALQRALSYLQGDGMP